MFPLSPLFYVTYLVSGRALIGMLYQRGLDKLSHFFCLFMFPLSPLFLAHWEMTLLNPLILEPRSCKRSIIFSYTLYREKRVKVKIRRWDRGEEGEEWEEGEKEEKKAGEKGGSGCRKKESKGRIHQRGIRKEELLKAAKKGEWIPWYSKEEGWLYLQ